MPLQGKSWQITTVLRNAVSLRPLGFISSPFPRISTPSLRAAAFPKRVYALLRFTLAWPATLSHSHAPHVASYLIYAMPTRCCSNLLVAMPMRCRSDGIYAMPKQCTSYLIFAVAPPVISVLRHADALPGLSSLSLCAGIPGCSSAMLFLPPPRRCIMIPGSSASMLFLPRLCRCIPMICLSIP